MSSIIHKKRSFTPTIDDLRKHNIKRFRLLSDFSSLNIGSNQTTTFTTYNSRSSSCPASSASPVMDIDDTKDKIYIHDIEEFLIENQDDEDVLETSRLIADLHDLDPERVVIPKNVIAKPFRLSKFDTQFSLERVKGRRRFQHKYRNQDEASESDVMRKKRASNYISNLEIFEDFTNLRYYGVVVYQNPQMLVYNVWRMWWLVINTHMCCEAIQFDNHVQPEIADDDIMIDDDGDLPAGDDPASNKGFLKSERPLNGNSWRESVPHSISSYGDYYSNGVTLDECANVNTANAVASVDAYKEEDLMDID